MRILLFVYVYFLHFSTILQLQRSFAFSLCSMLNRKLSKNFNSPIPKWHFKNVTKNYFWLMHTIILCDNLNFYLVTRFHNASITLARIKFCILGEAASYKKRSLLLLCFHFFFIQKYKCTLAVLIHYVLVPSAFIFLNEERQRTATVWTHLKNKEKRKTKYSRTKTDRFSLPKWKWQITRMLSSCFTIFISLFGGEESKKKQYYELMTLTVFYARRVCGYFIFYLCKSVNFSGENKN